MLSAPSFVAPPAGFVVSVRPQNADPQNPAAGVCVYRNDVPNVCFQYWIATIIASATCNNGPVKLNGHWNMSFGPICQGSFPGACATSGAADYIDFRTSSDDLCPRLIGTSAASATLVASSLNNFAEPQNAFTFGVRTYYQALVNSPVPIETLRVERITVLTGGRIPSQVLYDAPYNNNPNAYYAALNGGTFSAQVSNPGTVANLPTSMQVADNQTVAANSMQRAVVFSWVWNNEVSAAAGDNAQTTRVEATLRIRFAGEAAVPASESHGHLMTVQLDPTAMAAHKRAAVMDMLAARGRARIQSTQNTTITTLEVYIKATGTSGTTDSNTGSGGTNGGGGSTNGGTSSSGGSSRTTMVIGASVGVAAAVALAVVGALVFRRYKRTRIMVTDPEHQHLPQASPLASPSASPLGSPLASPTTSSNITATANHGSQLELPTIV